MYVGQDIIGKLSKHMSVPQERPHLLEVLPDIYCGQIYEILL